VRAWRKASVNLENQRGNPHDNTESDTDGLPRRARNHTRALIASICTPPLQTAFISEAIQLFKDLFSMNDGSNTLSTASIFTKNQSI
jgi:hypothetical protein